MGDLQQCANIRDDPCRRLGRHEEEGPGDPLTHSKNAFDITEFVGRETTSLPTPMQHAVYQLTDAKAHAQPTPGGHQAPVVPAPLLLQWATGASAADKKRKRDDSGDDASSDKDEDDDGDDGNLGSE